MRWTHNGSLPHYLGADWLDNQTSSITERVLCLLEDAGAIKIALATGTDPNSWNVVATGEVPPLVD
ncbi:hypothetical protein QE397_000011 [Rhodococcus sp. SORGH_AS 301]|nr:hypothetical protein [Rhodococcus sp. SORGH_AS_0301]